VAGHSAAQSPADQAQRAVPHRFRVLAGVPHHQGARHPAAAQEGQSPGTEQDAGQDDHGGRQEQRGGQPARRRRHGAQAAAGQGRFAQQGVHVEEPVQTFSGLVAAVPLVAGNVNTVRAYVAGNATNGVGGNDDDELIESLVKTVTATPGANTRTTQRERKRTKDAHRKSREYIGADIW